MRLPLETPEIHSCGKCYGKAIHVLTTNFGYVFCAYCNKPLLLTQIDNKILRRLKDGNKIPEMS